MRRLIPLIAFSCAVFCAGCAGAEKQRAHRSFWEGKQAYEDLFATKAAERAKELPMPIAGAILPHHLFVGHEMAATYNVLGGQSPSVVAVIGPNHFSNGRGTVQTTDRAFASPYGTVRPATEMINALVDRGIATLEPSTFDGEHAVYAHTAFIKRTFPKATIVPIVLAVGAKDADVDALGGALDELLPPEALVIASVDFSHYMRKDVADFHDVYARAAIERFSLEHVARLEVDSPESLRALLRYLDARGARTIEYHEHTNSADFTVGIPPTETTSHFYMAFGEGAALRSPFATVQFVGDTIVGRGIGEHPLARIEGTEGRFFRGMTVSIANLEGPITDEPPASAKAVSFAFERSTALDVLRAMGVTVANMVNNHAEDSGKAGERDTVDALGSAGIVPVWSGEPCRTVPIIDGAMAICSFTDTNGFLDAADVAKAITDAKKTADYVLVSLHWGTEYSTEPRPDQREKAAKIIAAGADAIVGHGPHVAQPMEWIDGKPVFYSIGNFLFDQPDPVLSNGAAAAITFAPGGIGATSFPVETAGGMPRLR